MKLIVLKVDEFTSKKNGTEYVKATCFSESGSYVEVFSEKAQLPLSKFKDVVLDPSDLKSLFSDFKTVDVNFNDKGRIDSVA